MIPWDFDEIYQKINSGAQFLVVSPELTLQVIKIDRSDFLRSKFTFRVLPIQGVTIDVTLSSILGFFNAFAEEYSIRKYRLTTTHEPGEFVTTFETVIGDKKNTDQAKFPDGTAAVEVKVSEILPNLPEEQNEAAH